MNIQEALAVAEVVNTQKVEQKPLPLASIGGYTSTDYKPQSGFVPNSSYKASDYHPLVANSGSKENEEEVQRYLDDSWRLLGRIMEITTQIAGEGLYMTTFNRGRLNGIADDISTLRKRCINIIITG